MMATIQLAGRDISYEVKRKKGVKNMRLEVRPNCTLSLTFPWYVSAKQASLFIRQKQNWILKTIDGYDSSLRITINEPFQVLRSRAQTLVRDRLEYFNNHYGYSYNKITIRRYKSRWGCCSHDRNLSFSYKLALLPDYMTDYIVVHELCHLQEFNHSKKFWGLVFQAIPNYKEIRKEIKYLVIE